MSTVTNIILHMGGYYRFNNSEQIMLEKVNAFFDQEDHRSRGLVSIDTIPHDKNNNAWYGGTKAFEASISLGAYNYLDLDAFVAHLKTIDWSDSEEDVELFVKRHEEDSFEVIKIFSK